MDRERYKEKVLNEHNVPYQIIDETIYAEKDENKLINVSIMSIFELYEWLGY